jgi:hypothetical protein
MLFRTLYGSFTDPTVTEVATLPAKEGVREPGRLEILRPYESELAPVDDFQLWSDIPNTRGGLSEWANEAPQLRRDPSLRDVQAADLARRLANHRHFRRPVKGLTRHVAPERLNISSVQFLDSHDGPTPCGNFAAFPSPG